MFSTNWSSSSRRKKDRETIGLRDGDYPFFFGWRVSNAVVERRWIRPVDITKVFGPIKGEHKDIRLFIATCFPAGNCLHSAGIDYNWEKCKSFSSPMRSSAGSFMALSGVLNYLCLGEILNIYAKSRFILENELCSSQGKVNSFKTAMHGKFEDTTKP